MPLQEHRRDPIAISVAVALGPVFTAAGYCMHLIYDSGAVFYFLFCALVIPFVTLLASRSRFLTWQLAVFSLMLSVIFDNLRVNAIDRREIVSVSFLFSGRRNFAFISGSRLSTASLCDAPQPLRLWSADRFARRCVVGRCEAHYSLITDCDSKIDRQPIVEAQ